MPDPRFLQWHSLSCIRLESRREKQGFLDGSLLSSLELVGLLARARKPQMTPTHFWAERLYIESS